jgi:hypothetical protein
VQGEQAAAFGRREFAEQFLALVVQEVESRDELFGIEAGTQAPDAAFGAFAGEHPVRVDGDAGDLNIAGFAGDREGHAFVIGHIRRQDIASGVFITVNDQVAAGLRP